MSRIVVHYVTSSKFKIEENNIFVKHCDFRGKPVHETFSFEIREVPIKETLEIDLAVMVQAEVAAAYSQLKVPCIVEHAGLVFDDYRAEMYPGGLTKPMWNSLKGRFLDETNSSGRRATATAVIAYCDGRSINTFVGETAGMISSVAMGKRDFYWDTVFVPDDPGTDQMTYAQIVGDPRFGLIYKVKKLSQSSKAMLKFLEYRFDIGEPELWRLTI